MSETSHSALVKLYPALQGLPEKLLAPLLAPQSMIHIAAGGVLFIEHQPCRGFPLLLSGSVKVVKTAANGREILLYRVEPGGSCIITSSCLLGREDYNARGIAESALTLLVLPLSLFGQLLAEHGPFRDFVFHLFAERIAELMQLVEEVAFSRLDQRLARLLLSRQEDVIKLTHQHLAEELGSVREIISRLLKGFAAQGLVSLGREEVTVMDRQGLRTIAAV